MTVSGGLKGSQTLRDCLASGHVVIRSASGNPPIGALVRVPASACESEREKEKGREGEGLNH